LHCFDELSRAFNRADVLFLCDVYAAGEDPIEGADSASLAEAVRARGHRDVTYVGDLDKLLPALRARLQPGDVLITLGAGNITRVGRDLMAQLSSEAGHGP
jgi:UDP-N-acetylmuramate--alanine ligase